MKLIQIQITLLSILFIFTACQDKGYGTQEISKFPILTSMDKVIVQKSTPSKNIAQRAYINIEFSAYIDPLTISTSTVSLNDSNGSTIPVELNLLNANLRVLPKTSLTPTHTYTLSLSSAITDLIGNSVDQNYNFTYLCKSDFWQSVESGYTHSSAISKEGDIYFWGTTLSVTLQGVIENKSIETYKAPLGITKFQNPHTLSLGNNSSAIISTTQTLILYKNISLDENVETNFNKLSLGNNHSVTIKNDKTLWSWGSNENGQLGNAGLLDKKQLVQEFTDSTDWIEVSAGENYTVALKSDNTMWGWGENSYGQIGNSLLNERRIPQQEDTNATDWVSVSAGSNHTAAIKKDGTLWSWGLNSAGELGSGDNNSSRVAIQESTNATDWKYVSCGFDHTLALKNDGTLWVWGSSYYGQLGLGNSLNKNTPTKIASLSGIVSISAGKYFSLAVDNNGTLWVWGRDNAHQLGLSTLHDQLSPQEVK